MALPSHGLVVTAAGQSERFQNSQSQRRVKKEFILLDDRTVLYHAVEPFLFVPGLTAIVVTYQSGLKEETEAALDNLTYTLDIPLLLVEGGGTRQQSVYLALQALGQLGDAPEYVSIHDGARPWITTELIISTLANAKTFGAAAPALPLHDALKRVDDNLAISEHLNRERVWAIQTPQIFPFEEILSAHQMAAQTTKHYQDDTEIFTDSGRQVTLCPGLRENYKITVFSDLPKTASEGLL